MLNDQPFYEDHKFSISCQVHDVLYGTSFAISGEVITTCLIEPTLMEKMGP